ncbi:leucine efflux protein LeuE [Hydromonas duriensis]|uniref:Threonine/homoserine/homoserine lactone efflux protein n=1 Tax=Hydromonas duriensis TaxID=1527608 RepID=A0A4R6Y839_9BURK|nr:leucine efflux protein LeuE [Hydromonas duriensis]TDR31544.1 threonine/homoserine/homoserine lactone efflux protein [Hydromonas duriensis]
MDFFTQLGITDITTYLIGAIAIILLPGPNSMYVLTTAAKQGVRSGYAAATGVFVGDAVIMVLAVVGAATLLREAPSIFIVLKITGALYLSYLGLQMLRGAWLIWSNRNQLTVAEMSNAASELDASEGRSLKTPKGLSPFKRSLFISLINPKAILFMLSFFLQFVSPTAEHPYVAFLVLGLILQLLSFLYLSALIFAGARLAAAFSARPMWMIAGTATVGLMFLGFGVKLAMATL